MSSAPETQPSLLIRVRNPADQAAWREFVEIYRPVILRLARQKGMQAAGLPYLVMPYVRGPSLQRRLDDEGPLAVVEILRVGMPAAAGLAAAHAQGLVHRDVKPANILLADGIERVKLTDFGLARAADDASLTRTGVIAGTPQYMSPEQARGEPVDPRSDLFSLGSVLYAICTGRPPFRAETSYGVLRRITDEEPRPIREINTDIPDWLCGIVSKFMAKRPDDRFQSAYEVSALLEQCLAHVQQPAVVPLPNVLLSLREMQGVRAAESASDGSPKRQRGSDTNPKRQRGLISSALSSLACASGWHRYILAYASGFHKRTPLFTGTLTMLTLLSISLAVGVVATNPPDISGTWQGDDWGHVTLQQTAPGQYAGTYTDTVAKEKGPGHIGLKWSRIERRFNGVWREGEDDRFGELSVRLVDKEIRGALTTDAKSKINPATPRLAELAWTRANEQAGNALKPKPSSSTLPSGGEEKAGMPFGISTEEALDRVSKALAPVLGRLDPRPPIERREGYPSSLYVNYRTRTFKIHPSAPKGYDISKEAIDETGPDRDGFMLVAHVQKRGEVNQARTPQTIHEPYWSTELDVTPIGKSDKQIYWALSYRGHTAQIVLREIRAALGQLRNENGEAAGGAPPSGSEGKTTTKLQKRAVNKRVKDFPEKTDLSTPESAMAAMSRSVARKDIRAIVALNWMKLDSQSAKEVAKESLDLPESFGPQVLDTQIIEVLTYNDDLAAVINKSTLYPASRPYAAQPLGRIKGEWKYYDWQSTGEDFSASVAAAEENFERRKGELWQAFVKTKDDIEHGRPVIKHIEHGPSPSLSPAEKADIKRWQGDTWQLGIDLDMPALEPQAVQYAVFDEDPVPSFIARIRQEREHRRLEKAGNEARKEQLREIYMTADWDRGFTKVTGNDAILLTKRPGRFSKILFSSNGPGGKKWVVTKTVKIDGKPVCWCIPVEVAKGKSIDIIFNKSNTFDLRSDYDNAMKESVGPSEAEPPSEQSKVTLPPYRIEAPDILQIELLKPASPAQPVTGQYLVGPDGTINLRRYGIVQMAGKTVTEARAVLQKHLAQFVASPEVSVDVMAYNSKVYYVITQGVGLGDSVRRLPITGNETVLDAIAQIGGMKNASSKKLWIARPTAKASGKQRILPID